MQKCFFLKIRKIGKNTEIELLILFVRKHTFFFLIGYPSFHKNRDCKKYNFKVLIGVDFFVLCLIFHMFNLFPAEC